MAATLKLCIMIHVEDGQDWAQDGTSGGWAQDFAGIATRLYAKVGSHGVSRGAKLSLQMGRDFVDSNAPEDPYNLTTGSSLGMVLQNGGNFWVHGHESGFGALESTYSCVKSAYVKESGGGDPALHLRGRSGGNYEGSYDPYQAALSLGMRVFNSTVPLAYLKVPQSLRPYQLTDDELTRLYHHMNAPGPLHAEVMTMRTRPFWMRAASTWDQDASIDTIYPNLNLVGSVMVIPQPYLWGLVKNVEKRYAYTSDELTETDLRAALTEIWTCFMLMTSYQSSITNVWYSYLNPNFCNPTSYGQLLESFVDSVNEIMRVHSPNPYGTWKNMNEIADLFSHTTSFYY